MEQLNPNFGLSFLLCLILSIGQFSQQIAQDIHVFFACNSNPNNLAAGDSTLPTKDMINLTQENDNSLIGVIGMKSSFKQGAVIINRDNLQEISGIGPFIEQKLNALGIFTFEQISKMDSEIEEQVNIAIEFFPGRVKRDEWARQAYEFNN